MFQRCPRICLWGITGVRWQRRPLSYCRRISRLLLLSHTLCRSASAGGGHLKGEALLFVVLLALSLSYWRTYYHVTGGPTGDLLQRYWRTYRHATGDLLAFVSRDGGKAGVRPTVVRREKERNNRRYRCRRLIAVIFWGAAR